MRAKNMQALTNDTKSEHPGVTVYGIGDEAHKTHPSDHNEDDTPGSKPAQTDGDSTPEHRAIDVMIGSAFTKADADEYVANLLADPAARARLQNIIWNRSIWSRSNGWKRQDYTGSDPHTNHVHVSGYAPDDENGASWPAVHGGGDTMFANYGETNTKVLALQHLIVRAGGSIGTVNGQPDYDSNYGANTANGLRAVLGYGDGKTYGPKEYADLFVKVAKKNGGGTPGPAGPAGPAGPPGPKGDPGQDGTDAVLAVGDTLVVTKR